MITKLATFRGVSPQGEPLVKLFRPGDPLVKTAGEMMPDIQDWMRTHKSDKENVAVLVNAMGASEFWGQNINGDIFPWSGLNHDCRNHGGQWHPIDDFTGKPIPPYGYWTFLNAHPFVHHKNKDPSRAFGKVVVSCLNPKMRRVELVVLLNRERALQHGAQHVVDRIDAGEYPDVSMGCKVPYDVCSICGHKSKTRRDYCSCIKHFGMNKILDDGRQVGVINYYPRFFDISFVFIGADKTAKVMYKFAGGSVLSADEGAWLYGEEEGSLTKAACARHLGACVECEGCSTKTASVTTHFEAEKRVAGSHMPTKHYYTASKTKDGKGAVTYERIEPKPEFKETRALPTNENVPDVDSDKTAAQKVARLLTARGRGQVKEKNFALPEQKKYPIHDLAHARNALTRVSQYGTPGQQATVRAAVYKKYPALKKRVTEKTAAKMGPPPSPNRKEYPYVGTIDFRGLKIYVENAAGDVREGSDENGKKWRTKMLYPYGEILGTKGTDKDRLDVYVGPNSRAKDVYIVHQNHPGDHPSKAGTYDEDKVMLGFSSPEEARGAYLKHYSRADFYRSMTIMPFEQFAKTIFEDKGEKVAELQKIAADMKLEDLFSTPDARRRERRWSDKVSGKTTTHTGSGLGDSFHTMQKTAAPKVASHDKRAEIEKEVEPSRAVGRVAPLLSDREEDFPREVLDELGHRDLPEALSTPAGMGMVLKPHEFQRIMLTHLGHEPLANELDGRGAVFSPCGEELSPCDSLGPEHFASDLMRKLLPFLEDRSYLGPVVKRRIVRITISTPRNKPMLEENSPLLSKISSAYNWYRNEMVKMATYAPQLVSDNPALHAGLFGIGDGDIFSKTGASKFNKWSKDQLVAILGTVPLSLMYSAHLRSAEEEGKHLGPIDKLIADHPWLTTMGASAAMREIVKHPRVKKALEGAAKAAR